MPKVIEYCGAWRGNAQRAPWIGCDKNCTDSDSFWTNGYLPTIRIIELTIRN